MSILSLVLNRVLKWRLMSILHRVGFLEYFCPNQGQDIKPSAAPHESCTSPPPAWGGGRFSFNTLDKVVLHYKAEKKQKTKKNKNMGTNMAAGNQQEHLSLSFTAKA